MAAGSRQPRVCTPVRCASRTARSAPPPIVRGKREGAPPTELAGIVSLGDLAVDLRVDEVPARTLAEVSEDSKRA